MSIVDVLHDPVNQMVLESALDELMEEVRRDEFVYVGTRKVGGERLVKNITQCSVFEYTLQKLTITSPTIPQSSHTSRRLKGVHMSSVC